jgi:transposase-like protein
MLSKARIENTNREYKQCHDLPAGYMRSRPKYSAEQNKVAVEHYLSHGHCLAATLKALGYPGRGTLAAWLDELHPETRQRVVSRAGAVSQPPELKQAAVIELCTREESAQVVAQRRGMSRPTLYNWKNKLLGREVRASMIR